MKAECYNCKFLDTSLLEDSTVGRCRRFPPVHKQHQDHADFVDSWDFPIVSLELEDWCGEFQLHPNANADDPDWRENCESKPPQI